MPHNSLDEDSARKAAIVIFIGINAENFLQGGYESFSHLLTSA
jgi:hypothetical protein